MNLSLTGPKQVRCIGHNCSRLLEYVDFLQLADSDTFARYVNLALSTRLPHIQSRQEAIIRTLKTNIECAVARYEMQLRNQVLSQDPEFHWCLDPACGSGQFCERDDDQRTEDHENGFQCHHCIKFNCLKHNRIHSPATCQEYHDTEDFIRSRAAEQRSESTSEKTTRPCPNCNRRIERAGGCVHMVCELGLETWQRVQSVYLLTNIFVFQVLVVSTFVSRA